MMLHDLPGQEPYPRLSRATIERLAREGRTVSLGDGQTFLREGETGYPFFAVLEGRVRIIKHFGQESRVLAVHGPGDFIGDITLVTGGPSPIAAQAQGAAKVLRIESGRFRRIAAGDTGLMQSVLPAMAERTQDVEAQARQREKLSALGKMAAGLAHELNNPAAAARRAAGQLREAVGEMQSEAVRYDCRLTEEQREKVIALSRGLGERSREESGLDPLTRSDREDGIANWLEGHGVAKGWEMASPLAGAGLTPAELEQLAGSLGGEPLRAAIGWLQAGIRVGELAADVEASAARISDLVQAMKEYSYMDQATFHELDVHRGLDSTLRMFAHRIQGAVNLVKEYSPEAPGICGYGNELNQVWTNLIDNALDAMQGHGTLVVRTRPENGGVLVEVIDSGPGIAPEIQDRVFEPFFTTKGVGQGTGLGLDISYRIVTNRHGGTIRVACEPGETKFQVWLPRNPPKPEG